jgi:hypothetical protein
MLQQLERSAVMFDQNRLAGLSILFGAMLLALAAGGAVFLLWQAGPAYLGIVVPAIIGAGLLTAGLVTKRENGWSHQPVPPARG